MKTGKPRKLPPETFERMKILAKANGFVLNSDQDVFRICYLADTFREVYGIGNMRPLHRKSSRRLDACPKIGTARETTIRRGKEVAENRQSLK